MTNPTGSAAARGLPNVTSPNTRRAVLALAGIAIVAAGAGAAAECIPTSDPLVVLIDRHTELHAAISALPLEADASAMIRDLLAIESMIVNTAPMTREGALAGLKHLCRLGEYFVLDTSEIQFLVRITEFLSA